MQPAHGLATADSSDAAFDPMLERAAQLQVADTSARIVRKADLIAMKERDTADPIRRRSKALRDQAYVELLRGDDAEPDEKW